MTTNASGNNTPVQSVWTFVLCAIVAFIPGPIQKISKTATAPKSNPSHVEKVSIATSNNMF